MLSVVFVRHGVTEATGDRLGGRTPASLSDTGRRQAAAVAGRLGDADVVAVYASPVARARETATIIAERHDLEAVQLDGVAEVDYGDWTDQPLGQLRRRKLWSTIMTTPSRVTFPGGESIRGAQARMVDALEDLAGAHRDGEVVVAVSHADLIKAAVAHFLGMPLDTFQRLVVDPASVSALHLPAGGPPVVLACNTTVHLPTLPKRP